jgi:4'-phosphopantetheinyl transferase
MVKPLCTAMTTIPPPLTSWSKHTKNRCAPDEIPEYWQKNDVITFLADSGMYDAARYHDLDAAEKEQEQQFKSAYFKKRFTVSRSILRHILHYLPGMENTADVILTREKNGRIRVNNRPDIFISLSYSGSCIAITVGKQKIGSDIEMVRPRELRKIRSIPLFEGSTSRNGKSPNQHLLHIWTLLCSWISSNDSGHCTHECNGNQNTEVSSSHHGLPLKDTGSWCPILENFLRY